MCTAPKFTWILPQKEFSSLVVSEDQQGEGKGRQPPVELRMLRMMLIVCFYKVCYLQRIHPETLVHARTVGQEGGQSGLEEETKIEEHVLHSLLED